MHVIKINDNQSLSWIEVPDPVLHDNEVLIKIQCAAMNRADLLQRAGNYPPPPGSPEWMGLEVSGTVENVGSNAVGGWKVGDKVCALLGGGGYAEKVAVDGSMLLPVPKGVSMVEAAALPEVYATSFLNLQFEAGIKAGDTVFIQAGASGLGIAATQLAKAWGAKVITTVSNDRKAEASRKVGADIVVNRKTEDVGAVLDANPPNIVLDCVGGEGLGKFFQQNGAWRPLDSHRHARRRRNDHRPAQNSHEKPPPHRQHAAQPSASDEGMGARTAPRKSMAARRIRADTSRHLRYLSIARCRSRPADHAQPGEYRKNRPDRRLIP